MTELCLFPHFNHADEVICVVPNWSGSCNAGAAVMRSSASRQAAQRSSRLAIAITVEPEM
jgi:hypothetical protein